MKLTRANTIKLGIGIIFLGLAGTFLLKAFNLRELLEAVFQRVHTIGPVPFFTGIVLLPALGFPLSIFSLAAGPAFATQLGLPAVCGLVVLGILGNLALTYWLSRYALHPLLQRFVTKLGYTLPRVSSDNYLNLTVLVRVTPGPPFFVQNYILGLAGIPFRMYMLVSGFFTGTYAVVVVLFGDSVMHGRGKMAVFAFSGVVLLSVLIAWIRRRLQSKNLDTA